MKSEHQPAVTRAQIIQWDYLNTLLAMIGEPYEEPYGCLKFLKRALAILGIEIEGSIESQERDGGDFEKVERGEFGTVIVWENVAVGFEDYKFHVGLMLDDRWAIQSSPYTNGVGRIEVTRAPWNTAIRGFYRHKSLT